MSEKIGISALDSLPLPPGAQMLAPTSIADAFSKPSVLECHSLSGDAFRTQYGTVRVISKMDSPTLDDRPVEAHERPHPALAQLPRECL